MSLPLDNPRVCPQCQGEGRVFEASHQRQDDHCFMCDGVGVISERVCNCGRPLVWYYGEYASCNALSCYNKAIASEKARAARAANKPQATVDPYAGAY